MLAEHYRSLERLRGASEEELEELPEIGPVVAQSVRSWFDAARNRDLVAKLRAAGVRAEQSGATDAGDQREADLPLAGRQFVLTGSLATMARDEARAAIESRGGRVVSSVSKRTSVVVAGAKPGTKSGASREARREGAGGREFKALLEESGSSSS